MSYQAIIKIYVFKFLKADSNKRHIALNPSHNFILCFQQSNTSILRLLKAVFEGIFQECLYTVYTFKSISIQLLLLPSAIQQKFKFVKNMTLCNMQVFKFTSHALLIPSEAFHDCSLLCTFLPAF